jgi:acyl-CoA synthetase (NDP forming)
MSHSGAVGVVCADSAERLGLPLPDLAPDTARKLQALMPSFGTAQNPVDLTAALLGDSSLFGKALEVLAADANMDLVQIGMPVAGQGYDLEGFARSAAEVAARVGKPMVVSGPQRPVLEFFSRQGLPTFQSDTEALRALKQYAAHRELLAETPPPAPPPAGAKLEAGLSGVLSEAESLRLLAQAGIPVVEHRECRSLEEALRAFRDIGRRCVLKACSRDVPHKSEHGLVWLALDSEARIEAAYRECEAKLGALGVRGTVLVAEMRSGRRELLVGARRDPTFGPLLVVGDGGKYVEALKDHELLCAPVSEDEVARALARLRIWPILAGTRGEAPADTAALGRAAAALGNLLLALPEIESVDMNPVMIGAAGEGARVLDALVTIR